MAIISMSKREFDQFEVLLRVQSGRLRVADACALLGRSRRQVFRLLRGIRPRATGRQGPASAGVGGR